MSFEPAPELRPRPCLGSLMDIPAGEYYTGKYGDQILSGGFPNFIGVGGRGNTHKTTQSLSLILIVLSRYENASAVFYDTENTASYFRIMDIAKTFGIDTDKLFDEYRMILTASAQYSGNEWWSKVREESRERIKDKKKLQCETPFLDRKGNPIYAYPPRIHFLDSLSEFETDQIDELHDKYNIDDAAINTEAARSGLIKTRMIRQIPDVTAASGMSVLATAHVGDETKMDPYAPSKKKLSFLKTGLQFKNVPEKFTMLTSILWYINDASALVNRNTKAPEYPKERQNEAAGETELMEVDLISLRSKISKSGHLLKLVVSQEEGLLPHLSEFHYLKKRPDNFGFLAPEGRGGQDRRLAIYPDEVLRRTNVRDKINADPRLQRALEITSELAQIKDYWHFDHNSEFVDPADLYQRLIDLGYEWDKLLDTRGYWTYDHYTNPVPPLSTKDLINMYHGRYIPFWYPEKKAIEQNVKKFFQEK